MKIRIDIDTGHDAFASDPRGKVGKVLDEAFRHIRLAITDPTPHGERHLLRDPFGNRVGTLAIETDR